MGNDRKYLSWALIYVMCGMSLGAVMAASHYSRYLAPSHVIMVGLVLSLVYGVIHQLWLLCTQPLTPCPSALEFLLRLRQGGTLTMFTALLLMYGNTFLSNQMPPSLAVASVAVLIWAMTVLCLVRNFSSARG